MQRGGRGRRARAGMLRLRHGERALRWRGKRQLQGLTRVGSRRQRKRHGRGVTRGLGQRADPR